MEPLTYQSLRKKASELLKRQLASQIETVCVSKEGTCGSAFPTGKDDPYCPVDPALEPIDTEAPGEDDPYCPIDPALDPIDTDAPVEDDPTAPVIDEPAWFQVFDELQVVSGDQAAKATHSPSNRILNPPRTVPDDIPDEIGEPRLNVIKARSGAEFVEWLCQLVAVIMPVESTDNAPRMYKSAQTRLTYWDAKLGGMRPMLENSSAPPKSIKKPRTKGFVAPPGPVSASPLQSSGCSIIRPNSHAVPIRRGFSVVP